MVHNDFINYVDEVTIIYSFCCLGCVTCGALAAGMTVGMLSLDKMKLQIKLAVGTPEEQAATKLILPVIEKHHLLLCTLLLFNAAANESLPIFFDALVPSWLAVVLSVSMVLLFGEILPSALFTGPNQLYIAGKFVNFIYFLEIIFYPIAYPMSKVLDHILGHDDEDKEFGREEISALVKIVLQNNRKSPQKIEDGKSVSNALHLPTAHVVHPGLPAVSNLRTASIEFGTRGSAGNNDSSNQQNADDLTNAEVNVITGVLGLSKMLIRNSCKPMDKVDMLSDEQMLDQQTIDLIDKVGHSRLPVFRGGNSSNILGYLLVKRLININPDKATPLKKISLIDPVVVGANNNLLDLLGIFQRSESHMAMVSEDPLLLADYMHRQKIPPKSCSPIGVITLEDVLEAMLQTQFYDEEDRDKLSIAEKASIALRASSVRSSFIDIEDGTECP